jgi:hypothetical protein
VIKGDLTMIKQLNMGQCYSFESYNFPGYFIHHNKSFLGEIASDKRDVFKVVHGLADKRYISLESMKYPLYFLKHQGFRLKLHMYKSVNDRLFKKDASFKVVPGLADNRHISFESLNYPGYFLRHQDFQLKLHKSFDNPLFKKDASFKIVPGLADNRYISFESLNYPGYFLRHQGFQLKLHKYESINDQLFRKDASFKIVSGLADNRYISFESLNYPGYFLRHQGFQLMLHKSVNNQLFKKDASFKMVPGLASNHYISIESLNYPGRYVRHRNFHLYLETDNDNLFRKDATFKISRVLWTKKPSYIGNFPENRSRKMYDNIQGITHDVYYWYFSQKKEEKKKGNTHDQRLYKFNASDNLSSGHPIIAKKIRGYGNHPGDITYFKHGSNEYIFVPMYKSSHQSTTSRILVFRASDLELVVASKRYPTLKGPSWVALDPSGRLYHNNSDILPEPGKRIQVYDVDWNKIANKNPDFLTHLREFPLYREDGREFGTDDGTENYKIQLKFQQGATFSPTGNLFFMSHGGRKVPPSLSGIKVFNALTGEIIYRSDTTRMPFKFQFDPQWYKKHEEPEGLTFWDLDDPNAPNAPNISGQLHVMLIRNDILSHDDFYIKHYRLPCVGSTSDYTWSAPKITDI